MNNKYTFNRNVDGNIVPEEVSLERWVWGAVYNDGTELYQFDNDGYFHQMKEIDKDKLVQFTMYKMDDQTRRVDIFLDPTKTEVFALYRNLILEVATENERRVKVYVFGSKDKETGKTTFYYILPDDRLLVSNEDLVDLTVYKI